VGALVENAGVLRRKYERALERQQKPWGRPGSIPNQLPDLLAAVTLALEEAGAKRGVPTSSTAFASRCPWRARRRGPPGQIGLVSLPVSNLDVSPLDLEDDAAGRDHGLTVPGGE
jgi:hypothetical protein